jgi:hypothetical protein
MLPSWPVSLFGAPVRDDAGFGEFSETPPDLLAIRTRVYPIIFDVGIE